jgi:hypothetical protein
VVLAGVLDRDGERSYASQTRQQALANADHLAILNAIWTDQTAAIREQRYRDLGDRLGQAGGALRVGAEGGWRNPLDSSADLVYAERKHLP